MEKTTQFHIFAYNLHQGLEEGFVNFSGNAPLLIAKVILSKSNSFFIGTLEINRIWESLKLFLTPCFAFLKAFFFVMKKVICDRQNF